MYCQNCETKLPQKSKFCFHCGAKIKREKKKDSGFPDLEVFDFSREEEPSPKDNGRESFFSSSKRFEIVQTIGSGDMGVVYKAKDWMRDRVIALKRFRAENKSTRLGLFRFLKNAPQIAELNHSNIIPIYDVGEDESGPFVSMELVNGQNLHSLATEKSGLSRKQVLLVGRQIGRALEFAHTQGVVHGAIKPSNVLLERKGLLKVGDFGLSRIFVKNKIQRTGPRDTFYVAPEQLMDSLNLHPSSDIYSFGKLLYFLTSGREEGIVDSSQIPPPLKRLILKATEEKPGSRYREMGSILDEIERALKNRTQVAASSQEGATTSTHSAQSKVEASCGHLNTKTSVFCGKCGNDLRIKCPSCRREYSEFEPSCPHCRREKSESAKMKTPTSPSQLSTRDWTELLAEDRSRQASQSTSLPSPTDQNREPTGTSRAMPSAPSRESGGGGTSSNRALTSTLHETMKDLEGYNFKDAIEKIKTALRLNRESMDGFDDPSFEDLHESPSAQWTSFPGGLDDEDSEKAQEYVDMAEAYLETYHFDKAIQYGKKALELDSNLQSAQQIIKEAYEKEKNLNILVERAEAHEKNLNLKMAYQEWSKALKIVPYHSGIRKKIETLYEKLQKMDREAKKVVEAIDAKKSYEDYVKEQGSQKQPAVSNPNTVKSEIVEKDLKKAKKYLSEAKFKEAKLHAKRVLQLDWSNQGAQEIFKIAQEMQFILKSIIERAYEYEKKKDYKKALSEWSKVLEITPSNKKVHDKISQVQNKIKSSLDDRIGKAEAYFENKEYRRVLLECQKILKLYPSHKYCQRLVEKSKEALKKAESYLAKAKKHFQKGEWDQVVKFAKKSLEIDWKKTEAQELLKKAVKVIESEVEATNRLEEAEKLIEQAQSFLKEGNYDSAIKASKKALELDQNRQEAVDLLEKARIRQEKGEETPEESEPSEKEEATSESDTAAGLENFLNAALNDHNEEARRRKEAEVEAIISSSDFLVQQDQADLAIEELEKGLKRHPDSVRIKEKIKYIKDEMNEFQILKNNRPSPSESGEETDSEVKNTKKTEKDRRELAAMFQELISDEDDEGAKSEEGDKKASLLEELSEFAESAEEEGINPEEAKLSRLDTDMIDREEVSAHQEKFEEEGKNKSTTEIKRANMDTDRINDVKKKKKLRAQREIADRIEEKEGEKRALMDTDSIDKTDRQKALMDTDKINETESNKAKMDTDTISEEDVEEIAGMETISLDADDLEKLDSNSRPTSSPEEDNSSD